MLKVSQPTAAASCAASSATKIRVEPLRRVGLVERRQKLDVALCRLKGAVLDYDQRNALMRHFYSVRVP